MDTTGNLLDAIKRGDKRVIDLLYAETQPGIRTYILRNGGNVDDAKDIFQDAIMLLVRQILRNKYDDTLHVQPYLFTIAKNLWINKVKRDKRVVYSDQLEDGIDEELVIEHIQHKERHNMLQQLLIKVGERCAELLRATVYDEKSHKEIAEEFDLKNANTVKTYTLRCRKRLIAIVNSEPGLRSELEQLLYNNQP